MHIMSASLCYVLSSQFSKCCFCPRLDRNNSNPVDEHLAKSTFEDWARQVRKTLQEEIDRQHPNTPLRQALLEPGEESEGGGDDFEEANPSPEKWIVMGVPRRPLFKELAWRLLQWTQQEHLDTASNENTRYIVPAQDLGFQEGSTLDLGTPPQSLQDVSQWIAEASDERMLRLLGMRNTVGTACDTSDASDSLRRICPSRTSLLEAAEQPHRKSNSVKRDNHASLTVAARARSKHAHRGQEGFFGVAKGSVKVQNEESRKIIQTFLENAIWINIHKFGGLQEGQMTVEIRVVEGYGARWIIEKMPTTGDENISGSDAAAAAKSVDEHSAHKVAFRGFLEPEASNGHDQKWRH
jgi:hypothetical protein